jgi:hypothetical protein
MSTRSTKKLKERGNGWNNVPPRSRMNAKKATPTKRGRPMRMGPPMRIGGWV